MSGNVWEWCLNEYDKPRNCQESGNKNRVLRGGGWNFNHYFAAAAVRYGGFPNYQWYFNGFRVVLCRSVPVTFDR